MEEKIKRKYLELILGLILLAPPVFSVASYSLNFVGIPIPLMRFYSSAKDYPKDQGRDELNIFFWFGRNNMNSQLPVYFGLMAIAGALLITNSTKK
jgi:hypothetical protein